MRNYLAEVCDFIILWRLSIIYRKRFWWNKHFGEKEILDVGSASLRRYIRVTSACHFPNMEIFNTPRSQNFKFWESFRNSIVILISMIGKYNMHFQTMQQGKEKKNVFNCSLKYIFCNMSTVRRLLIITYNHVIQRQNKLVINI